MEDSVSSKDGSSSVTSLADPRNIDTVVFGDDFEFKALYGSTAFFSEAERKKYAKSPLEKLYVCSRCFKYATVAADMGQHLISCSLTTPGRIIYQYNEFSIREVDGEVDKLYCQCLSLFAKLFVDTKSVYFAVNRFKFYVLIHHVSSKQEQAVGYFSKEKLSWDENNLACILVFPPFQGQGLGQLLIEFSYQISVLEGKLGSPEKPLSESGFKSYLRYWCTSIARGLLRMEPREKISVNDIANETGIRQDDVMEALRGMNAIQKIDGPGNAYAISKGSIIAWVAKNKIDLTAAPLIDINCMIM